MKNDLLGYVLGALDADEQQRVDGRLNDDPALHQELDVLRDSLDPLKADEGHINPPDGLATRCCEQVKRQRAQRPSPATTLSDSDVFASDTSRSKWSFSDFTIAAGILVALGLVAVPTVNHSRFNAQLMSCQNNLRDIGQALQSYSQGRPDNAFPAIATPGPQNTNTFATTLVSEGHLRESTSFNCPSTLANRNSQSCRPAGSGLIELEESSQRSELDAILDSGLDYAYTLGHYDDNGRLHPTRNQNRSSFVIMSDLPCESHEFRQTSSHGSLGQNVLFEDGRVSYEENCCVTGCRDDDFFHNRDNEIAPGVDEDDAVVGTHVRIEVGR